MVVYHYSHLQSNQEGHHFITSCFIFPQILNFERSLSLSAGPQSVLFSALQKSSWRPCVQLDICVTLLTHVFIVWLSRWWESWKLTSTIIRVEPHWSQRFSQEHRYLLLWLPTQVLENIPQRWISKTW